MKSKSYAFNLLCYFHSIVALLVVSVERRLEFASLFPEFPSGTISPAAHAILNPRGDDF